MYIQYGTEDKMCRKENTQGAYLFYDYFEANTEVKETNFNHLWPADLPLDVMPYRNCTDKPENPFVSNCGFDFAGNVLRHLLPNVKDSNVTQVNDPEHDW